MGQALFGVMLILIVVMVPIILVAGVMWRDNRS